MEIVRVDSLLERDFIFVNVGSTSIAPADKSLLSLAGVSLVDPVPSRTLLAEEVLTTLAVVPDVFEVEH